MTQVLVGVDEAGRGALAGPVAVGVACIPHNFDWSLLPGVRDSKLLSPKKRETIYTEARRLASEGVLDFRVALVGAPIIDRVGITRAVSIATARALARLPYPPEETEVQLDGLLRAPASYVRQHTIVKGDFTEPVISLASILAKVTRDRHMARLAKRYPSYHFEVHKGYGTSVHREMLGRYGRSDVHRATFCTRIP